MTSLPQVLPQIKNIIIDLDGTLVQSNDAHAHSFVDMLEANGIRNITYNDLRKLMGMNGKSILEHTLTHQTAENIQQMLEQREQIFKDRYLDLIDVDPMASSFLDALHSQGLRVYVSSASPEAIVKTLLQKFDLEDKIEGYISSADVVEGKPNPLAIEACCEKFGLSPTETLLIGDSPYDIIAGHEFSMPVITVLSGGYTREELEKTGAAGVFENLGEIQGMMQQIRLKRTTP